MAKSEVLNVDVRQETGRHKVKKLRAAGKTPAVIYGHGGGSISLSVSSDEINKIVHSGDRIVSLGGGVDGDAFIRDVQWDLFGSKVVHVDFTRVQAGQMIETTVSLEFRGEAPGSKMGGVVEQGLKEMRIEIPPRSMTDKIEVRLHELNVGEQITVGDLDLPEGSKLLVEPTLVVAQCVEKQDEVEQEDDEVAAPTGAEPEVIGEKKDDEAGDDS